MTDGDIYTMIDKQQQKNAILHLLLNSSWHKTFEYRRKFNITTVFALFSTQGSLKIRKRVQLSGPSIMKKLCFG